MYRRLYTLIFVFLLPAILVRLLLRSIKSPAYRKRWAERFGIVPVLSESDAAIWIHAVSVGETLAAVPLLKALQERYPDRKLVVTTTTPTGSERVHALFAESILAKKLIHVYAPYDFPLAINKFLCRIKPQLLIIMETELWPNMIHFCSTRQVPVLVANARLSEKSARGYARLSPLTKSMLDEISMIAVQNTQDGNRFLGLGLAPAKLRITGSIKFDLELPDLLKQRAAELKKNWSGDAQNKRTVLLAASTHAGEDEIILSTFKSCKKAIPGLLLILVPRHPERFNSVYQLCLQAGFRVKRRSENNKPASGLLEKNIDIVLGDTMGELLLFYGACDIAFVGGSLVSVGGHNLVEPAAWAKPIICGKHLFNFDEVKNLLADKQALVICNNGNELQSTFLDLLQNRTKRQAMGEAAQKVAMENRGALQKLISAVDVLIQ